MQIEYLIITNLEQIVTDASSNIQVNNSSFNYILAYQFDVSLINCEISEATDEAKLWADKQCPNELYFNHGYYIDDGLEHVIEELRNKPSSNRALFSLLSQKNISKSGDEPIPSFLIFQTCIDSDILYCTTYFRALEVSNFLRINIEELRLKIASIYQELARFSTVRLVIFAFRGYNNPLINPLRKAKIDLMTPIQIFTTLEKTPRQFYELIREKAKESTVIYLDSLYALKESLDAIEVSKLSNALYAKDLLNQSIDFGIRLKDIRTKHSHHESVDQLKEQFASSLNNLANEFEKCH